jgi:DNA polymerase III subunit delta'
MQFAEIEGLEDVKSQLIHGVKTGHVAHAQLFLSREGGPNLPMALAYATFLNCESPTDTDSCGTCGACSKMNRLIHPDLHFVYPVSNTKDVAGKDAVSSTFLKQWRQFILSNPLGNLEDWLQIFGGENGQLNISKEESRNIIRDLSLKAFEGKYKIMLVWLPEFMHPSAANAILKILEEPSPSTVFLMVANDAERLLITITSRLQKIYVRPFSPKEIERVLQKKFQLAPERAAQMAFLADGNINEALRLIEEPENNNLKLFREWMLSCYHQQFAEFIPQADAFHTLSKLAQRSFLLYSINTLREVLLTLMGASLIRKVPATDLEFVDKFSKTVNPQWVEKVVELINDAHYHLERNGSPKIIYLDLCFQVAQLFRYAKHSNRNPKQ